MRNLSYLERHDLTRVLSEGEEPADETLDIMEFCEYVTTMGVYHGSIKNRKTTEFYIHHFDDLYSAVEIEFGKNVAKDHKNDIRWAWKERYEIW